LSTYNTFDGTDDMM